MPYSGSLRSSSRSSSMILAVMMMIWLAFAGAAPPVPPEEELHNALSVLLSRVDAVKDGEALPQIGQPGVGAQFDVISRDIALLGTKALPFGGKAAVSVCQPLSDIDYAYSFANRASLIPWQGTPEFSKRLMLLVMANNLAYHNEIGIVRSADLHCLAFSFLLIEKLVNQSTSEADKSGLISVLPHARSDIFMKVISTIAYVSKNSPSTLENKRNVMEKLDRDMQVITGVMHVDQREKLKSLILDIKVFVDPGVADQYNALLARLDDKSCEGLCRI